MLRTICALLAASLVPAIAFSQEKPKKLDPCALLTAADAASIVGAPMKIVDRTKDSCTYGEYRGKGSLISGGVLDRMLSFGVGRHKDAKAEDKEWSKTKASALSPANKDQTQELAGIGDEAYLVGRTSDGQLTDDAAVHARKGTVTFSIVILLPPGHQPVTLSAEALITTAKRVADQL